MIVQRCGCKRRDKFDEHRPVGLIQYCPDDLRSHPHLAHIQEGMDAYKQWCEENGVEIVEHDGQGDVNAAMRLAYLANDKPLHNWKNYLGKAP